MNIRDYLKVNSFDLPVRMKQAYTRADPAWTKEETDYLFDIVREYDLRFYVIADRYEFPGGEPRTIEVSVVQICRVISH